MIRIDNHYYIRQYYQYLIDLFPNAMVAYSLRKLRGAYTGGATRARRSSDNTEQGIGFTSSGELDVSTLETFVGYNLFAWSEQLQQAYWSKTNLTVTTDTVVAPDTTTTGDILYETTTNNVHSFERTLSVIAGADYTVSFWVKAEGRNFFSIRAAVNLSTNNTSQPVAFFDLTTGTVQIINNLFRVTPTMTAVGGGWYKIEYGLRATATASSSVIQLNLSTGGTTTSYVGDVTKGISVWGLQLTQSSTVRPYRKTETVAEGGGFGTILYDNSLSGVNAVQTSSSNQPILAQNGYVVSSGSKPAIQGGGALGFRTANQNLSAITDLWLLFVVEVTDTATVQTLFETSNNFNNNNSSIIVFIQSGNLYIGQRISSTLYSQKTYTISTGRQLLTVRFRTGQTAANASEVWINGNSISGTVTLNNSSIVLPSNQPLHFFARAGNTIGFLGKYQEVILYGTDQTTQRANIENKINEYYGIY